MTSSVEDMDSLPELSSILEQGITAKECSHQLEKDSSNDEDFYADSSMEGSAAALNLFNLDDEVLRNSMAIQDVVETVITEIDCQQPMEECLQVHKGNGTSDSTSYSLPDEISCLTDMTSEEQKFFEHYQNAGTDDISSVKCTVCSKQLFVLEAANIRIHPVLGVLMCKDCRGFYSSGQFSQDDSGIDEYCRWCAEGGSLICCDSCTNVFCKSCLRRSLGRAALAEIKNGGSSWNCLVCNNLPIWSFRAQCRMVLKAIEENKRKSISTRSEEKGVLNKNDPKAWVPACIGEAEKFASTYKSLVTKVGNLWSNDVKELSNVESGENFEKEKIASCCRKLRRAIVAAQFNLKLLEKKLVRNFKRSYGSTVELEEDGDSAGSGSAQQQSRSTSPHQKRLVLKIKNFREANKKQDFYAEIRDSPVLQGEKTSKTDKGDKDSTDTIDNNPSNGTRVNKHILTSQTAVKPNQESASDEYFDACSEMDANPIHSVKETRDSIDNKLNNGPSNKNGSENTDNTFDLLSNSCDNDVWKNFFNTSQNDTGELQANVSGVNNFESVKSRSISNQDRKNADQSSRSESSRRHSKSPVANEKSPRPSKNVNQNILSENESVRRELLKNSSSDSDSSDSFGKLEPNAPRMKKTMKRFHQAATTSDTKLKSDCAVVIKRITELDSDNKTVEDSDDLSDSKLEKKIQRLADLNSLRNRKSQNSDSDSIASEDAVRETAKKERNKSKKSERQLLNLSDLSSSSSDSECESKSTEAAKSFSPKNSSPILDLNEAARKQLLLPSSSEDSGQDSDSKEVEEKTIKQEKENIELKEEGSDQVETNTLTDGSNGIKREVDSEEEAEKKTKNSSKLLRVSLADSDASENEKSSKKKGNKEKKAGENEDKKKKKKRRIHSDSSDFESGSDSGKKRRKKDDKGSDGEDEQDSKPKRRRRIKQASTSGEGSDSDVQVLNESQRSESGNKGRKNIKKIIKDKNLQDETKAAAKEEEERRRRIAERQKCYNEVFIGDEILLNAKIDNLVLDFDPTTKKELVTVHHHLVNKLKPHQVKGVKFMWDACFESLERIKEHPGSGCILAHCMGLGKSLQVVTLVHTVLNNEACQVNRVLVVCPLSTVLNWVNEFKTWLTEEMEPNIFELASVKTNDFRMYHLRNWFENGGVMILGYDMFRNLTNEKAKRIKPKFREIFQKSLVDPGPDLVVCDEGHLLKNENTATSKAMNRIQTKRRIVLTGTPLQNSLTEYHCMIQFVKPNLLGNKREFTNRFANPIKNGQCADSTDHDVRIMKRRAHVLHKMLEGSVQRFDYSVLTPFLPPKHEYVISVKMSDLQITLYQYYLERCAKGGPNACMPMGRGKGSGLFADFQELGRVWTHPKALHIAQLRRDLKSTGVSDSEGSMADFIDDRSDSESDEAGVVCLDDSGESKLSGNDEDSETVNGWKTRTRSGRGNQPPPEDELGTTATFSSTWWSQFIAEDDMVKIEHSGKLTLLMDILRQCELIGDKVLVFSQSLVSLDLIEEFLVAEDERMQLARSEQGTVGDQEYPIGSWRLNCDYFRLDGSTSAELRKNWCNCFNNPQNIRARLFLISTRAGGLGINLVAANRVIIFDASWNPSHDVQSIFRVYRFGQRKPCYVYRFLAQGTMEEKIYDRQVTKLSLSCRVVDEQQIERHFNSADLSELYRFDPDSHTRRPTPMVPKDRLLAELTIRQKEWIVTYHEHDSLLENKEEEELSEEERKAAWEDFENEKRGVNTSFSSEGSGTVGMPDIYGLAGRTVAGVPLANIASMILNANPGISQDEFLGRLRLTVDQLQNFSVQHAAASIGQNPLGLQQPGDAQRLLMQRQAAAEQLKRQFGNGAQTTRPGVSSNLITPGPSGLLPQFQPRSRGRPPIGPHQRVDLYGIAPLVYGSAAMQASQTKTSEGSQGSKPQPKT